MNDITLYILEKNAGIKSRAKKTLDYMFGNGYSSGLSGSKVKALKKDLDSAKGSDAYTNYKKLKRRSQDDISKNGMRNMTTEESDAKQKYSAIKAKIEDINSDMDAAKTESSTTRFKTMAGLSVPTSGLALYGYKKKVDSGKKKYE